VARGVSLAVAVLDFVTVQVVPFPVRVQRRTLEPDGLALFTVETTGDGSGGNVLVTVRADSNEFFFLLKTVSAGAENLGASDAGMVVMVFNPEWLNDLSVFPTTFNLEAWVDLILTTTGVQRQVGRDVAGVLQLGAQMPLGKVSPLTSATQNLFLLNYNTNVNSAIYRSSGLFYAYRKEALTVPGFLEALIQPGLIR